MSKTDIWFRNITKADLNSTELALKIPAEKTVNLFKLNPNLTRQDIDKSLESGFLKKCKEAGKIIHIQYAPEIITYSMPVGPAVSKIPIPSRIRSAIVMDNNQDDFIEELSNFSEFDDMDRYTEGFSDPMVPVIVKGEDGVEGFKAISIKSEEKNDVQPSELIEKISTKVSKVGDSKTKHFVIEPK